MLRPRAVLPTGPRAARVAARACVALGLSLALLQACAPAAPEPVPLRLLQASPEAGASGVFLNERVVLDFSRPLDPASLHARSARVVDGAGRLALGRWSVQGARLTFTPDPVLSPTLDDGGYRPGERYRVELAGFPRPDGLRSTDGAPLERGCQWEFAVVENGAGTRRGFLFEDSSMDTGYPLVLRSERIGPREAILLEGGEPVDPSSLFGEDFVLQAWRSGGGDDSSQGAATELIERIGVRARLIDNRDRRSARGEGATRIELQPLEPLRAGPDVVYQLHLAPGARLRDFGGHPVLLAPRAGSSLSHLTVVDEVQRAPLVYSEHFLGTENRSPLAVPGADGTAWWGGESGRVEVRFLEASGDGSAGDVALGARLDAADLHAVRLQQESAQTVTELEGGPGCVVLRAQGSLRIDGTLRRRGAAAGHEDFLAGESLSAWIARMQAEGRPVTVLVASGDILVTGEIDLDGPLLLAAGGRVRLVGQRMVRASSLYVAGDRGGQGSFLMSSLAAEEAVVSILPAPLRLDPPSANRLVEPLTFAVRSGPIPRRGRVRRWHPLQVAPGGRAGAGAFRVRFVGERSAAAGSGEVLVDDPMRLEDCPTLRLQVELSVEPGPTWDPPWVDFVELSWETDESGGGG